MDKNGWPVRLIVGALLCTALAVAPGCGGGSDDDSAPVNSGPGQGQDPGPNPTPEGPGWNVQAYGNIQYTSVSAVDANHAWVAGHGQIKTENGGATWTAGGEFFISKLQFIDVQNGWGRSNSSPTQIRFTSDGSATWETRLVAASAAHADAFGDFSFVSTTTGWVVKGSSLLKTTDNGQTWTTTDVGRPLHAVKFVNEQVGWVTAHDAALPNGVYRNVIMKTTDGGVTWEDQFFFTGDGAHLRNISAVSPNHAWVGGEIDQEGPDIAVILATTDGGATWTRQAEGLEVFRKIHFIDPNVGWLITSLEILRSMDGGATWTSQEYPSDFGHQMLNPFSGFADVFFVDENNGWVVGDNGIILHTSTGGQ